MQEKYRFKLIHFSSSEAYGDYDHRTNTYIDDCVTALAAIYVNFKPGEVYNIASSEYCAMPKNLRYIFVLVRHQSMLDELDVVLAAYDEKSQGKLHVIQHFLD